jgi:hypothetical protein
MELDHTKATAIARQYFGTTGPLQRLGWGISGFVYLSPDAQRAVKVHTRAEGFAIELKVYRKLQALGITRLHGLTVPKLRDHRNDFNLICMDVVSAPFLLDFAGVLFNPPDYSEDTMDGWHRSIAERFGPNASVAYSVYHALAKHGMYYMDFRPSNLNLTGLPGLEPMDQSSDDDVY